MRAEEVLKLVNAGFTKEEIIKMEADVNPQPQPQPQPQENQKEVEEPEKPEALEQPQQPIDNKQVGIPAALNETLAKLNDAITQLQQQAVMNSQQPAKLSTDDILASIINPPNYQSK